MPDAASQSTVEIVVVTHGAVPDEAVAYARKKIGNVIEQTEVPVLFARLKLLHQADPAVACPAVVEAHLDVEGRLVQAHHAAHQFHEAVDRTEQRLRDRLKHLADRRRQLSRGGAPMVPGEWRHSSPPTVRPAYFPRPPEERELVRRTTLPLGEMTLEEAAFDLELLDQDFYLFREIGGSGDSLIERSDGHHHLHRTGPGPALAPEAECDLDPSTPPRLDIDEAIERIDLTDEPFVFFCDRPSGRGEVLYRRDDGHYGLIEPAS